LGRANQVVQRLKKLGWINDNEYNTAIKEMPVVFKETENTIVSEITRNEIATCKSLQFKKKSKSELNVKNYHSYQIGIILRHMQLNYELFIPDCKIVFPKFVLQLAFSSLQLKVFDIIAKYDKEVKKDLCEIDLIQDVRWTPIDISYLLYYLTLYKNNMDKNNND
jgi:hypothetical protein